MRPTTAATLLACLSVLSLTTLSLAGCGSTPAGPDAVAPGATGAAGGPDLPAGGWTRLPDSPLSAREAPAAAHVSTDEGELAVFVGGDRGQPCPPTADCIVERDSVASDGAAYNLDLGVWQPIADAPRPVSAYASTAVIDETLYVRTGEHLLAWDAEQDSWTELDPPTSPDGATLVADTWAGTARLLLVSGTDENGVRPDQVLAPADGTWSRLPADPLRPSFDRAVVSTPHGLVLTAKAIGADGGPEDPALVRAALLPRGASTWQRLPSQEDQLGGWAWTWSGRRLVDATPGGSDGGQVNNYGRTIPHGGALDPATGVWEPLEDAPEEFTGGWGVEALGGRYSAVEGWIYDDGDSGQASSWTRLTRPDGAPAEPGRGVWIGDVLIVSGGADWDGHDEPKEWTPENVWSTGAWAYRAG